MGLLCLLGLDVAADDTGADVVAVDLSGVDSRRSFLGRGVVVTGRARVRPGILMSGNLARGLRKGGFLLLLLILPRGGKRPLTLLLLLLLLLLDVAVVVLLSLPPPPSSVALNPCCRTLKAVNDLLKNEEKSECFLT